MYILTLVEERGDTPWLIFDTLPAARQFLALLPGYRCERDEETQEILSEWIAPYQFPLYQEIAFRGNRVPITRFMFEQSQAHQVEVYVNPIPCVTIPNQGLIDDQLSIGGYRIATPELEAYITTREAVYTTVANLLQKKGYTVERAFEGSEDGEAILYRRTQDTQAHFLVHLDPAFVEWYQMNPEELIAWVEEELDNA